MTTTDAPAQGGVKAGPSEPVHVTNDASQPLQVTVASVPGGTAVTSFRGAANQANGQVTAGAAATLVAARPTRRSVTIVNTDTVITVYIGAATVTAGNGVPLKAGQSISVTWVGLIQVLAASGSPVVAFFDEYD